MKITVITVCFNSKKTIEKAIKSVISQNYIDKEYIVIDGGSTDGTLDVIKKYNSNITKWISEPDKGIFDAMNKGIGIATGDIIAFLNSDDWYMDNVLSKVCNVFEENDCDCVCCDNYVVNADGSLTSYDMSNGCMEDMYKKMIFYHSAIFTRKKWFQDKNNFDIKYKMAADYNWILKIMNKGAKLYYLHWPVFTFCYGGISSVNKVECAREAWEIAVTNLPQNKKKYLQDINNIYIEIALNMFDKKWILQKLKKNVINDYSFVIWGAGNRGKQCLLWLNSADIEVIAIVDNDKEKEGTNIYGVNVYLPQFLCGKICNVIITPNNYYAEIYDELKLMQGVFNIYDLKQLLLDMGKV